MIMIGITAKFVLVHDLDDAFSGVYQVIEPMNPPIIVAKNTHEFHSGQEPNGTHQNTRSHERNPYEDDEPQNPHLLIISRFHLRYTRLLRECPR